ncbi:MAG: RNA polymerase factor sigma-54 [Limnohabitans sp.]|jgi:RNA polymerase sigma-54 factor|nr:RNA polymerase factor sigma-54 [Limnohabitans sp.]
MKQGLSLRVSQHLALTPQLQQSIRLLQLSTLELNQEIEQMLDDNPFLEKDTETADREAFGLDQADAPTQESMEQGEPMTSLSSDDVTELPVTDNSMSSLSDGLSEVAVGTTSEVEPGLDGVAEGWEGDGSVEFSVEDTEWGGDAPPRNGALDEDTADATELARSLGSLTDFLHQQALSLRLGETDRAALRFLIESLNDDGYLEDSLRSLAEGLAGTEDLEQLEELEHRFEVALRLLQTLEPTGVGARDLAECLTLQLKALDTPNEEAQAVRDVALAICRQPLELLAKRDIKRLVVAVSDSDLRVKLAIALIGRLEPKPGRRFVDVERQLIVPDVIVTRQGADRQGQPVFRVQLNSDVMPRLRVHDIYASALKGAGKGEGHQGLQQRLQEARWFIKNIQQRFETILRVSNAIAQRQRNFFIHGELAMRPMVLREIADELGLHESTISRVTTAKYMATPFGTFELKYFFGSGLGTDSGNNASSTAVRALIKQFVASENPKKPLSDNQISEMLKEQGIDCARRTVAKYREALRIAPTHLRKAL